MYCCKCDASIEEDGGSQMKGCYHFLCTNCLVEATRQTEVEGIVCAGSNGIYQCNGYLTHEELEHMVPDEIFGEYLERISELATEELPEDAEDESEPDMNEGAAAIPPKNRRHGRRKSAHLEDLRLTDDERNYGWAQKACLIDNLVRFEGFSSAREAENFVDKMPLMETRSETACPICLEDKIPVGEGVVLKDCLHMFCKDCLRNRIRLAETSAVTCPFAEEDFQCEEELKPKEILALVGEEEYRRHFENLSLREAAASIPNVFHCLTPDQSGVTGDKFSLITTLKLKVTPTRFYGGFRIVDVFFFGFDE